MNKYICKKCNTLWFSSAELKDLINPNCESIDNNGRVCNSELKYVEDNIHGTLHKAC